MELVSWERGEMSAPVVFVVAVEQRGLGGVEVWIGVEGEES